MREKRDFSLRRNAKPITPEKLMRILNQTEGGERAKDAYRNLTGEEPPEEMEETNERENGLEQSQRKANP